MAGKQSPSSNQLNKSVGRARGVGGRGASFRAGIVHLNADPSKKGKGRGGRSFTR